MSDQNQPGDWSTLPSGFGTPPRDETRRRGPFQPLPKPSPDHGTLPETGKRRLVRLGAGAKAAFADLDGAVYWRIKKLGTRVIWLSIGYWIVLFRTREAPVRYIAGRVVYTSLADGGPAFDPADPSWTKWTPDDALDALVDSDYIDTLPDDLLRLLDARLASPEAAATRAGNLGPAPPDPPPLAMPEVTTDVPKKISDEEANIVACEYLKTEKRPTLRGCGDYIKSRTGGSFADGRVCRLPAWRTHMEQRSSKRQQQFSVNATPLTDAMLASRKGKDPDPSEIAAENEKFEIEERRYVESLTE